jgi:carboxylesterase type B
VPVSDLVSNFGVEIPGVVDGSVLTQSIGTALARGQFARVPVIDGITHDEELLFVDGLGIAVSGGTNVPLTDKPVSSAPPGALPPLSTHGTELPYLFDQPNAPFPATLNADQQALAASMRAAWSNFAASGDPSSRALPWPSFGDGARVLSLAPLQSKVETDSAAAHHCSFWAAG